MDGGKLQEISGASVLRQSGHVHISDLLCSSLGQLCHHPGQYHGQLNNEFHSLTPQINWFIYSGNLLVEVKRKELRATQQTSEEKKKED